MKCSAKLVNVRKSLAFALAFAQLSLLSFAPVFAADNKVRLAGNPVFAISGPLAQASDRANKIQSNIDNSLVAAANHGPSSVKISYVKGLPVISLGGYYISTVDNATAKTAGTTPTLLAQKWANSLKSALADEASVRTYIAQLTGVDTNTEVVASVDSSSIYTPAAAPTYAANETASAQQVAWQPMPASSPLSYSPASYDSASSMNQPAYAMPSVPSGQPIYQGRVSYVPQGMMIPVKLATSLSSQVAKAGDMVVAKTTEDIILANGVIPANSTLIGQVTTAQDGAWLTRSGKLGVKFTTLRTPNGIDTPISAHISGKVGKYADNDSDTYKGENTGSKIKKTLVATAVGAGGGSALGLAVGAISGGGRGVGKGAWSGAAIGAGVGMAQSLLARKGTEVNLMQGEVLNLQLDAPVTVAMN